MPLSASVKLIRYSDHVEMAWKNGGGLTREIARGSDDAEPYWRLSLATVDISGPFSILPGCFRIILLLEGPPMTLHFEDGEVMPLARDEPRRFSCERPLQAVLPVPGERRDLNLIWNNDELDGNGQIVRFTGQLEFRPATAYRVIVVATKGASLALLDDGTKQDIAAGDTLVIDDQDLERQTKLSFEAAEAELVLFTLYRRR